MLHKPTCTYKNINETIFGRFGTDNKNIWVDLIKLNRSITFFVIFINIGYKNVEVNFINDTIPFEGIDNRFECDSLSRLIIKNKM